MADQAAGLRRRSALRPLHCIHCCFRSPDAIVRLADALHARGRLSLLVDASGRVLAGAATRALFGWREQLARGELNTLPAAFGAIWHAPGLDEDAPPLRVAAADYDVLLMDAGAGAQALLPLAGARQDVVVELEATEFSLVHAYALLKTLACEEGIGTVVLLGEAEACARLHAACRQFLDAAFCQRVQRLTGEGVEFTTLAVRMMREEPGPAPAT
jgi:hypothetical protein